MKWQSPQRLVAGGFGWTGWSRFSKVVAAAALALPLSAAAWGADEGVAGKADAKADAKPAAAERVPPPPFGEVRKLEGEEWSRACEARDRADLRRSAHESRYHAGPGYPKNDRDADADFEAVVAAYREASAAFPGTEFDCYCRLRLGGAYQYRGDFGRALEELKQAAELFAGTAAGPGAEMDVGLFFLQAAHQPREAEPYFQRVRAAAAGLAEENERAKWSAAADDALDRCRREAPAVAAPVAPAPPEGKQGKEGK